MNLLLLNTRGLKNCLRQYHTRNCFGYWRKPENRQTSPKEWLEVRSAEANLWRLVSGYHQYGHRVSSIDPLSMKTGARTKLPQLLPEYYGLDTSSRKLHAIDGILFNYQNKEATIGDILEYLEAKYCGPIAIETGHMSDCYEQEWLIEKFESVTSEHLLDERRLKLGQLLLECQVFDQFLAKKFATLKRYGAEGAESMMGFFEEAIQLSDKSGVSDIILCMPHRGRLNLLTSLLRFPPQLLFHKIKGNSEFLNGSNVGDVPSHLASSFDYSDTLHLTMLPNPSHLEAVNPVAMGKARARMLSRKTGPYSENQDEESKVVCIQVHGDGAISGQGVVMETLGMSRVPHFEIGGTVHFVVNNNLGFTTPADHGRSSAYCSDIAKMTSCPVIHVNGDYPEEVVKACRVAMSYRMKFDKDVFVVMNCFRKWGHNELDDPSMTQPHMYRMINSRSSVPDSYWEQLKDSGVVNESLNVSDERYEELNRCLKGSDEYIPPVSNLQGVWSKLRHPDSVLTSWDTGVSAELLKYVGAKSVEIPDNFSVHSKLEKAHIQDRLDRINEGNKIDWSTAETMAVGSLLYQGYNVRLSGQDVGRGTFSHRHMMLVDQVTDESYIPLNRLTEPQSACLEVANSHLSEEAVLGFEYGYSIESPNHLVIWEAQFGDFFNGAQVIIDTFISSGEAKWLLQSGLVMLLPHGYDGAGPEHSSCRVERFLQMCNSREEGFDGDDVNMHVAHPTTPAQYFHLLRRQMMRNFRKPLIVQSPKILLRLPAAISCISEMAPGTAFHPVIEDKAIQDPKMVSKVIICSGKHFYALDSYRKKHQINDTAIIRLELLCPFPSGSIYHELTKYSNLKEVIWSQEEPSNMGPWLFVEPRFRRQLGINLKKVSRPPYGPPASGVGKIHLEEAKQLMRETFKS